MSPEKTDGVLAVVLAAGASRRLGRPKQLVMWRGTTLVRRTAAAALASRCAGVVVVTGAHDEAVRSALEGLPVRFAFNEHWREGVAASVRAGVHAAAAESCHAVVCLVCDQPALDASHVDRLIAAGDAGATLVGSRYAGHLGVPALFGNAVFGALLALRGDEGARHLLRASKDAVGVDWDEGTFDIDVPGDVEPGGP
jgi:CTP:molybdopterin cytidylyltransferase MocA